MHNSHSKVAKAFNSVDWDSRDVPSVDFDRDGGMIKKYSLFI